MKKALSLLSLAALTIGLLGSCSKIDERISNLEKRIDGIESEQIASIKSQVDAINTSIADLGTIRQNVQTLMNTTPSKEDMEELRRADEALGLRIDELKSYTEGELKKYATTEWVKATFATLEQHQWTCDTIAKIDARICALDAKLSQSISGLEGSLKRWVNGQLDAYYTAAQMDAKLDVMRNDINNAKAQGKTATDKADSLATELTALKTAVDTAKANIRSEYKAAIQSAIETSEGKLTQDLKDSIAKVNDKITALDTRVSTLESTVAALTGRVDKLEKMIQSVTILPAYTDGSVEAEDGTLTIDFVVSPAAAVKGVTKDSIKVLVHQAKVQTKAASYESLSIESADVNEATGDVTITANISKITPAEGKALTVAVNIKNGISDFTTEFVTVESHFTYAEIAGVKWALENLAVSESGKREFKNTGHVIGDYFQWATYAGYCGDASGSDKGLLIYSSFTSTLCGDAENAFSFKDASYQFSIPDWGEGIAPYCTEDEGYTKYTGDAVSTLESTDDAATIILGEEWRMPTIEEYQSLYNATYWAWDATDCGYYVFLPSDAPGKSAGSYGEITGLIKSKAKLFFPASGYVDYTSISETPCAQYLSSSYEPYEIMPGYLSKKFKFDMMSTPPAIDLDLNTMQDRRACGASIRPVKAAAAPTLPAGALKGEFSVSADKKVHFSQGNLWYGKVGDAQTATFQFESNQYEFHGYDSANNTWGLFGWVGASSTAFTSSPEIYGATTSGTISDFGNSATDALKDDWGTAIDDKGTWSTLSKDEWTYLFNTRTMANGGARYENLTKDGITVESVIFKGVVLFPDNFTDQANWKTEYTTWEALNNAGIVFLPAAGRRYGSSIYNVDGIGYYWSSTAFAVDKACRVYFNDSDVDSVNGDKRHIGESVRLVTEVK